MITAATEINPQSSDWFASPLGKWLISLEQQRCLDLVPDGYYPNALQLGLPNYDFFDGIEIGTRYQVILPTDYSAEVQSTARSGRIAPHLVKAMPGALPFTDRTHSLIVLPHLLERSQNPHEVLREVNQVLIPEGCLVITGFNPLSYWNAGKLNRQPYANAPWLGHKYRVGRVQDWLALLGFDIVGASMLAYSLPLQNEKWRERTAFMEKMGDRWWPALGAGWILVSRKREIARSSADRRTAWQRFIPAIARPAVSAGELRGSRKEQARAALKLVVSNKQVAQ